MNPLLLNINDQAKAGVLRAHPHVTSGTYLDGLIATLYRAKYMASGLGAAVGPPPGRSESDIDPREIAAITFTIADHIDMAIALLDGLEADVKALHTTGAKP
jgi:hypothetical protein